MLDVVLVVEVVVEVVVGGGFVVVVVVGGGFVVVCYFQSIRPESGLCNQKLWSFKDPRTHSRARSRVPTTSSGR